MFSFEKLSYALYKLVCLLSGDIAGRVIFIIKSSYSPEAVGSSVIRFTRERNVRIFHVYSYGSPPAMICPSGKLSDHIPSPKDLQNRFRGLCPRAPCGKCLLLPWPQERLYKEYPPPQAESFRQVFLQDHPPAPSGTTIKYFINSSPIISSTIYFLLQTSS